eukprot:763612-Hanusia_phi.AAC.14
MDRLSPLSSDQERPDVSALDVLSLSHSADEDGMSSADFLGLSCDSQISEFCGGLRRTST